MNNPYQTPESDVEVPETPRKTGWKILAFVLLGFQVLSIAIGITDDTESIASVVADLVIYSAILVGIFAYAFNKRIWTQNIWKPALPVAIAYDIYYLFIKEPLSFESTGEMLTFIAITAVVVLPLAMFQYIALYRYAFKAPEIWK